MTAMLDVALGLVFVLLVLSLLASAIAEIRGRQISGTAAGLGHRVVDMPEFREMSGLVGGLSDRLETLEGELKLQRTSNGSVNEVASQVEQLTHVVELLAGAVGETGQVKRLEAQMAAPFVSSGVSVVAHRLCCRSGEGLDQSSSSVR